MLKEAYTTNGLMQLLKLVKTSVIRRAGRKGWQGQKRNARGGGFEWFFASITPTSPMWGNA